MSQSEAEPATGRTCHRDGHGLVFRVAGMPWPALAASAVGGHASTVAFLYGHVPHRGTGGAAGSSVTCRTVALAVPLAAQ